MSTTTLDLIKEVMGIKKIGESGSGMKKVRSTAIGEYIPITSPKQYMKMKDGLHRAYLRVAPLNQDNLNIDELDNIVLTLQEMFNAEPGAVQIKASNEPLPIDQYLDYVQEVKNDSSSASNFSRIESYENYILSKKSMSKGQKKYYVIVRSDFIQKDEALKDLESKVEIIKEKFEAAEMKAYLMSDDEVRELFYRKMNPRTSLTQTYDPSLSDSDLFPSYVHDGNTYLEVDEVFFRQYFITKYPEGKDVPGWFKGLIEKNNVEIDFFFVPADADKLSTNISNSIQNLKDKRDMARAAKDKISIERKLKSQERMLQEIHDNRGYDVSVVLTIHENSLEKLDKLARHIELAIRSNQMHGKLLARRHFTPFNYYLPLCYTDNLLLKYSSEMHSKIVASILPFNASEITSNRGVITGYNPSNDSLIIIDRYDRSKYNNGNGITLGASGSGKTYAIQTEIDRSITMNTVDRVVAIDPEAEFKFPYGQRVVFEIGGKHCTNPFHLRSVILDSENDRRDGLAHAGMKMLQQTSDIVSWLRWIHTSMSAEEASKISKVIRECYKKHGIVEKTEHIHSSYEAPTLLTFEYYAKKEGLDNLVSILEPYIHGEYRSLFCGPTNWDMKNKLTVLDLYNLQLGMQSPLYDLLIRDIWAEFKTDRNERTGLYCDEAHRMLNRDIIQTLIFIVQAFKQFRKYGSYIEIMTQQVGDIIAMGIEYAQQIFANAAFKKYLYMDSEWEHLLKVQHLSDKELKIVQKKTKRGRGVLIAGDTRTLYQSEATLDQLEFIDPDKYTKAQVN
ncbi:VirB4 family type IV secretion system protein [Paenibacillus melissococcoides]|uniref:VirB4 family type IV secretion system protein n=1 Tax=Paenibacillus melissococcoides TaxID=2912268 RepID=UPI0038B2D464